MTQTWDKLFFRGRPESHVSSSKDFFHSDVIYWNSEHKHKDYPRPFRLARLRANHHAQLARGNRFTGLRPTRDHLSQNLELHAHSHLKFLLRTHFSACPTFHHPRHT